MSHQVGSGPTRLANDQYPKNACTAYVIAAPEKSEALPRGAQTEHPRCEGCHNGGSICLTQVVRGREIDDHTTSANTGEPGGVGFHEHLPDHCVDAQGVLFAESRHLDVEVFTRCVDIQSALPLCDLYDQLGHSRAVTRLRAHRCAVQARFTIAMK